MASNQLNRMHMRHPLTQRYEQTGDTLTESPCRRCHLLELLPKCRKGCGIMNELNGNHYLGCRGEGTTHKKYEA
jgi:hypothetical protein